MDAERRMGNSNGSVDYASADPSSSTEPPPHTESTLTVISSSSSNASAASEAAFTTVEPMGSLCSDAAGPTDRQEKSYDPPKVAASSGVCSEGWNLGNFELLTNAVKLAPLVTAPVTATPYASQRSSTAAAVYVAKEKRDSKNASSLAKSPAGKRTTGKRGRTSMNEAEESTCATGSSTVSGTATLSTKTADPDIKCSRATDANGDSAAKTNGRSGSSSKKKSEIIGKTNSKLFTDTEASSGCCRGGDEMKEGEDEEAVAEAAAEFMCVIRTNDEYFAPYCTLGMQMEGSSRLEKGSCKSTCSSNSKNDVFIFSALSRSRDQHQH